MSEAFAVRTRERLREEILAAAADEVVARGWRGLRMQVVADAVGVSRQTIYNEFLNKQGLAEALVIAIGAKYADECERIVEESPDIHAATRAGVLYTLASLSVDEVFRAVMAPEASDTFLPLYATGGLPLINYLTERISAVVLRRWPELDPERARIGLEMNARILMSFSLAPSHSPEYLADVCATLIGDYLAGGPR